MTPMHPEQRVAAVILAAGASSRFGSPKQLARVGTRTMLEAVVDAAAGAGLDPVLAVVPPGMRVPATATSIINDESDRGLSRSMQLGVAAVPDERDAAIVLLGDQPAVAPGLLERLVAARGTTSVIATSGGGVVGPPVLLERGAFVLVDQLSGDVGLRDLLRRHPAAITAIEVEGRVLDVDEPHDLEGLTEACQGCGARFLPHPGDETHPYIGASSACWAAYGELLAREYGDPRFGRVHRHSADVYAAQHPGLDGRRQRQSVALHLVALCHWLEHGLEADRLNAITRRLAAESRTWPRLDPPTAYSMTVLDVLDATNGEEHARLVHRWAEATWRAWSDHHVLIRRWAGEALD